MYSSLIASLLSLGTFCTPAAQAEVLLSYASHSYQSGKQPVAFDNTGNLWVAFTFEGDIIVSRIDPKGNPILDKVLIRKYDKQSPTDWSLLISNDMICDRWNNAYFTFSTVGGKALHLTRITPEGYIQDYFPWPKIDWEVDLYMETLASDTLLLIGANVESSRQYGKRPVRVAKALLDSEGLTPLSEADFDRFEKPSFSSFLSNKDLEAPLFTWKHGYALKAGIYPRAESPAGPANIVIHPIDLIEGSSFIEDTRFLPWRDYVWRSYPDSWIGKMTFAPYKDGGYTLFFPDPLDRSTTYMLRLNEDGELLDPADLKNGGERSVKAFGRLPSGVEPHAYFYLYRKGGLLDSARVSFWGCDDEGNLYNYTQLRKY